jgi:hypothetical protein
MKNHHKLASGGLCLALAAANPACAGKHAESKTPATAMSGNASAGASSAHAPSPSSDLPPSQSRRRGGFAESDPNDRENDQTHPRAEEDQTELIVSREVVARCPTLRLVREHIGAFDPDMAWLAVLESIADCMSEGGAMAKQAVVVSGDEEHRDVVRQVLGSRGVAPTRVTARPVSPGAAECQGGIDCNKRVEISIGVR